jgi:hypothetical protein
MVDSMEVHYEDVECVKCHSISKFIRGHLTEQGKSGFLCNICREPVLERQVEEKRIGNRRLLTEN